MFIFNRVPYCHDTIPYSTFRIFAAAATKHSPEQYVFESSRICMWRRRRISVRCGTRLYVTARACTWRRRRSTVRNSTFRIFSDLYVAAAPNLSTLRHAPVRCGTRLHEIVGISTKQYGIVRNPYYGKKWRPLGGSPMAIYISGVEKNCNHNSDFSSPVLHFTSSPVLSLSVQTWLSLQVNRSRPSCV